MPPEDPTVIEFDVRTDEMLVNMGPQHPSTHGVLRIVLRTDGEMVLEAVPHLGYLHRCKEKIAENLAYYQYIGYTDRLDYLAAMNNNHAWSMAVEKLADIEVPQRAEYIRVLAAELNRIASHLVSFGTYGLDMGAFRSVERTVDPLIECCRPIAALAILPLAILWLGTGTAAAVMIVAYAAFFPIVVNTVAGAGRVEPTLLRAAATMGLSRFATLRTVVIPAALPAIGVGLRIGMGVAWTAIIAAELAVGAKAGGGTTGGIGQMMFVFYAYSIELNRIIVCMIAVGIVALALDRMIRLGLRLAMPWSIR
jgi:ABC-type nitrate/sulfonate/bicarbonate transport system permease component